MMSLILALDGNKIFNENEGNLFSQFFAQSSLKQVSYLKEV